MIDLVVPCFRRDNDFHFWLTYGPNLFDSFLLSSIILGRGPFVLVLTRSVWTGRLSWSQYPSPQKTLLPGLFIDSCYSKAILQLQAFAFTTADYLLFLDCDLRLTRESLQSLIDSLARHRSKGTAAYIGDVYESESAGSPLFWSGEMPVLSVADDGCRRLRIQRWSSVCSRPGFGNVICRRDDYISCGGHDPRYRTYGWEDHDLLIALQLDGCMIFPASFAFHLSHDDSHRLLGDLSRSESVNKSKRVFMEKYKDFLL